MKTILSHATIVYADVPNDEFEDIVLDLGGGWADSSNQACFSRDGITDALLAENKHAYDPKTIEVVQKIEDYINEHQTGTCDVVIQKVNPK